MAHGAFLALELLEGLLSRHPYSRNTEPNLGSWPSSAVRETRVGGIFLEVD